MPDTARTASSITPWWRGALWYALAAIAAVTALTAAHGSHLREYAAHDEYFYDGVPLLTTADGYYYLRLASEYLTDIYEPRDEFRAGQSDRPAPPPLLVLLAAGLNRLTDINIDVLAFYLPAVLAALSILVYILWGPAIGGPLAGLVAALAGGFGVATFFRSTLGRFDTDGLNVFFVLAVAYGLYRFATTPGRSRWLYLAGAALMLGLFDLWWPQIGKFSFVPFLGAYAASVFLPTGRRERRFKIVLLVLGAVAVVIVLFDLSAWFPAPLSGYIHEASRIFEFVSKDEGTFFPEVGRSIDELAPLVLLTAGEQIAGGLPILLLGVAGAVWLAVRRPAVALFGLMPTLVLGAMAFFAQRFAIFLTPIHALGLGFLVAEALPGLAVAKRLPPFVRQALAGVLAAGLLAQPAYACVNRELRPSFIATEVNLGLVAQRNTPDNAMIWNWWDSGYFLQYWAARKTFIDGGNQMPLRNYLSFAPLASSDPEFARRWIKFFAVADINGFNALRRRLGSQEETFALIHEILAKPADAETILKAHGLTDVTHWKAFLLPPAEVYLCLTPTFIIKSWWYAYGRWQPGQELDAVPKTVVAGKGDTRLDFAHGLLIKDDRGVPVKTVVEAGAEPKPRIRGTSQRDGYVLIDFKPMGSYFLVEPALFDSLVFRLLFRQPETTPGFTAITYHPLMGGIWKVE